MTLSQELPGRPPGAAIMQQQYLDLHRRGNIVHSNKTLYSQLYTPEHKMKEHM